MRGTSLCIASIAASVAVVLGQNVQLSGFVCPGNALDGLNGIWVNQGVAAGGQDLYQKSSLNDGDDGIFWLYFDSDCAGDGLNTSLWVIGAATPNRSRIADLDASNDCAVDAFIGALDTLVAPPSGTWQVACSPGSFTSLSVTVSDPPTGQDDGLGLLGTVYLTGSIVLLFLISGIAYLNREKLAEVLPFSSPISSDRSSPISYA